MPYTLIQGSLHIHYPAAPLTGPEPDGDTLRFQPRNRTLIDRLPRPNQAASFNRDGITSIRFEGIDALETHFDVEGEELHQKLDLALTARDALLVQAGFGDIRFFANRPFKVESVQHHPVDAYILSNGLDTYGRTIAFVFTGTAPVQDGSQVFATPQMIDASLNSFMLRAGHAYPAFYLTLPPELREHLRSIVKAARLVGAGLWPQATATVEQPAQIDSLGVLQELVIWPKLFRRLAPYFVQGNIGFDALDAWLRADPRNRDDRLLLSNIELGNMHDLIVEDSQRISLSHELEDIVIVPDDFAIGAPIQPPPAPLLGGRLRIVAALIRPAQSPERGSESVTLLNAGDADLDLAGWRLADNAGQQPIAGSIAAGETLRIRLAALRLSNTRDTITLLDPAGKAVDQVAYEARDVPPKGVTKVF